ncbi:MAG: hypothetical protein MJE77_18440 [Proteobacteria bacterium]|nr:hypothetical protein [Pseudomonadota bacterium]
MAAACTKSRSKNLGPSQSDEARRQSGRALSDPVLDRLWRRHGGTSATIGRYVRYAGHLTEICVVDPSNSVFFDYYHEGEDELRATPSGVEGIGRPRVEPSFQPSVGDRMIKVPDVASYAAMHFLKEVTSRQYGGSTGTNLYGAFQLIHEMAESRREGSVVMLICDGGERCQGTYYSAAWRKEHGFDIEPYLDQLRRFYRTGEWRSGPLQTQVTR